MDNHKTELNSNSDAEQAIKIAEEANTEQDCFTYTHKFKKPFSYRNMIYEQLTFDWGSLTGKDHMAIENEILRRGKTLILPAYTSEFLCGMAVRACIDKNEEGFHILNDDAMKAMPMRDFQTICQKARDFLLRGES